MEPFRKVVKTEEEKRSLVAAAKKEWDSISPAVTHLIAASEEDYLSGIADAIQIESQAFVPPRELTSAELGKQNGELVVMQVFGDRASDPYEGLPTALREMAKANDEAALAKLLGPSKHTESALDEMIRKAVESVVVKGSRVPVRESERPGLALAKGRIEFDQRLNESTQYSGDGAFLRCWHGAPDKPGLAA
jgi:hypothetical protein